MAPINPVNLKATISSFVRKISAGGNNVSVLEETGKLLTTAGKQFDVAQNEALGRLLHKSGRNSLLVTECPGQFAFFGGEIEKGKKFLYQIRQDGKIADFILQKPSSISKEAEQILFDILA